MRIDAKDHRLTPEQRYNRKYNAYEQNKYRVCYYCGRSYPKTVLNYYDHVYNDTILRCDDDHIKKCKEIFNTVKLAKAQEKRIRDRNRKALNIRIHKKLKPKKVSSWVEQSKIGKWRKNSEFN